MSTTIRREATWSTEIIRKSYGRSPLLRVSADRDDAARMCSQWLQGVQAKHLYPLLSGQLISELRHRGGAVALVVILMRALPHRALAIASYLMGKAVAISGEVLPDFAVASRAEQVADAGDDPIQLEAAMNPTRENLVALADVWAHDIAARQVALASLNRHLETLQ